jgi:predicted Rossmann-fold nucleotide-binding protein
MYLAKNLLKTLSKRNREMEKVEKIISGGQTGVDRAALDTVLELGFLVVGVVQKDE